MHFSAMNLCHAGGPVPNTIFSPFCFQIELIVGDFTDSNCLV